jgi:hypothetical protein
MANLEQITLPSGTTYDLVDAGARALIAALNNWEYVLSVDAATTPYGVEWDDSGTTIVGTLVASSTTKYKIYLVPGEDGSSNNIYDEYVTIEPTTRNYDWEQLGSTSIDLSNLGDLAYKDTASGSVTVPKTFKTSFTGKAGTVSVSGKTTGSVSTSKTQATIIDRIATGQTAPVTYTPAGTVSAPTISISSAGSTATVEGIDSVGSMPTFTVSGTTLKITAGSVPTKAQAVTVKTSDASYTASQPKFTGTGAGLYTYEQVVTGASFTGSSMTSTGSFTPEADSISTVTATTESKTVTVS